MMIVRRITTLTQYFEYIQNNDILFNITYASQRSLGLDKERDVHQSSKKPAIKNNV